MGQQLALFSLPVVLVIPRLISLTWNLPWFMRLYQLRIGRSAANHNPFHRQVTVTNVKLESSGTYRVAVTWYYTTVSHNAL